MTNTEDVSSNDGPPALPEKYTFPALMLGFFVAYLYYTAVIEYVPNEYWPLHLGLLVPIVYVFLGVPALIERLWRKSNGYE